MRKSNNNPLRNGRRKGTKKEDAKRLFEILYDQPVSRRMAATILGYPDMTYMVTQSISDWLKIGKVQVIGNIKCSRSGRYVESVSANPDLFKFNDNQLKLF